MKIVLYLSFMLLPIVTISGTSDNSRRTHQAHIATPITSFFSHYFQKIRNKLPELPEPKPETIVLIAKIAGGIGLGSYYAVHIRNNWLSSENNDWAGAVAKGFIDGTARLAFATIFLTLAAILRINNEPGFGLFVCEILFAKKYMIFMHLTRIRKILLHFSEDITATKTVK